MEGLCEESELEGMEERAKAELGTDEDGVAFKVVDFKIEDVRDA